MPELSTNLLLFLTALGYSDDDIIEIRPIRAFKEPGREQNYADVKNRKYLTTAQIIEHAEFFYELNTRGHEPLHILFGVNPRKSIGASGDSGVAECRCFFVDFDAKDYARVAGDANDEGIDDNARVATGCINFGLEFIRSKIRTADLPQPTLIVATGHGFHCYWSLADSISIDEWRPLQINLIDLLGSDRACSNPERIMRLPGFYNVKYDDIKLCQIVQTTADTICGKDFLCKLKSIGPGEFRSETGDFDGKYDSSVGDRWRFSLLDGKILGLLDHYKIPYSKVGSRNDVLVHCIFPNNHGGQDDNPSFSLGYRGKYIGIGSCFSCNTKTKGGQTSYTLLDIILKSQKERLTTKNRHELALELNNEFPGFYTLDSSVQVLSPLYPAFSADYFAEKYFTIDDETPENGMVSLFNCDGIFYRGHEGRYVPLSRRELNSMLWNDLRDTRIKKSADALDTAPFPVNQKYVDDVVKALLGIRDIKQIRMGYERSEDIGSTFWINRHPDNVNPDDLIVCLNKVINYRTGAIFDLTLNLFCPTPLPVIYDKNMPEPKRCDRFLRDNLETQEQIRETLKMHAFMLMPVYCNNQAAFFCTTGRTGSGRSTIINFLKTILSKDNYLETSFSSLGDKFGLQNWPGKLAAFISDDEVGSVNFQEKSVAMLRLKKISSGDEIDVRLPGGHFSEPIKFPTKIIYNSTTLPTFHSSIEEFLRRMYCFAFKKQYNDDKERYPDALDIDKNCLNDMIAEKDSYFTHRVIGQGVPWLLEEGLRATTEQKELTDEISDESNIYGDFWDSCTQADDGPATESNSFSGVVGIKCDDLLLVFCEFSGLSNRKFNSEGLTYPKLARRIRGVRDLKSAKIGANRTTLVVSRSLTEYAKGLIKNKPQNSEF